MTICQKFPSTIPARCSSLGFAKCLFSGFRFSNGFTSSMINLRFLFNRVRFKEQDSHSTESESLILICTLSKPINVYLFEVDNRNTRKRYDICSKLTIKTPERGHWCCSGVFIVNFEHVSYLFLGFLLVALNK